MTGCEEPQGRAHSWRAVWESATPGLYPGRLMSRRFGAASVPAPLPACPLTAAAPCTRAAPDAPALWVVDDSAGAIPWVHDAGIT